MSIINHYHVYEDKILTEYESERDYNRVLKESFEVKICAHCGAKMRYISGYNFWGCPNYKDGKTHASYDMSGPNYKHAKVRVEAHWVTEILKSAGLYKVITAKAALDFLLNVGMRDLRDAYGYENSTADLINNIVETTRRSKVQEAAAFSFLQEMFPKAIKQQTIKYKLAGERDRFCIPDFICGNEDDVMVVDAKLDFTNDKKMKLYVSLVDFIIKNKGDNRKVSGAHIMYVDRLNEMKTYNIKSEFPIIKIPNPA